jgi:hypothetical protein
MAGFFAPERQSRQTPAPHPLDYNNKPARPEKGGRFEDTEQSQPLDRYSSEFRHSLSSSALYGLFRKAEKPYAR